MNLTHTVFSHSLSLSPSPSLPPSLPPSLLLLLLAARQTAALLLAWLERTSDPARGTAVETGDLKAAVEYATATVQVSHGRLR